MRISLNKCLVVINGFFIPVEIVITEPEFQVCSWFQTTCICRTDQGIQIWNGIIEFLIRDIRKSDLHGNIRNHCAFRVLFKQRVECFYFFSGTFNTRDHGLLKQGIIALRKRIADHIVVHRIRTGEISVHKIAICTSHIRILLQKRRRYGNSSYHLFKRAECLFIILFFKPGIPQVVPCSTIIRLTLCRHIGLQVQTQIPDGQVIFFIAIGDFSFPEVCIGGHRGWSQLQNFGKQFIGPLYLLIINLLHGPSIKNTGVGFLHGRGRLIKRLI